MLSTWKSVSKVAAGLISWCKMKNIRIWLSRSKSIIKWVNINWEFYFEWWTPWWYSWYLLSITDAYFLLQKFPKNSFMKSPCLFTCWKIAELEFSDIVRMERLIMNNPRSEARSFLNLKNVDLSIQNVLKKLFLQSACWDYLVCWKNEAAIQLFQY